MSPSLNKYGFYFNNFTVRTLFYSTHVIFNHFITYYIQTKILETKICKGHMHEIELVYNIELLTLIMFVYRDTEFMS